MNDRRKERHPALKHAGYSAVSILPGESAAEFAKLQRELVVEFSPHGCLEVEIVTTIAHCVWRRRNLAIFRIARHAREAMRRIRAAALPAMDDGLQKSDNAEELEMNFMEKWHAADNQAREQLGELYALIEMDEEATMDRLKEELEVQSRLDAMIDRCIRRLLLIRGVKSMSLGSASPPPRGVCRHLSGSGFAYCLYKLCVKIEKLRL